MREIKFRGKRLDNGEWITGDLITSAGYAGIATNTRGGKETMKAFAYRVDPETVGQFTGLFDKNDKEIYEGDVFTVLDKYPKVVRFISECACFCVADADYVNAEYIDPWRIPDYSWWIDRERAIKIIGNEHDNPEFLQKTQNKTTLIQRKQVKV